MPKPKALKASGRYSNWFISPGHTGRELQSKEKTLELFAEGFVSFTLHAGTALAWVCMVQHVNRGSSRRGDWSNEPGDYNQIRSFGDDLPSLLMNLTSGPLGERGAHGPFS